MASDKSTDFIKRNRPPRVNISYEDPYDSEKMVELPFVLGVMSDLSGNASEVDKPEMEERDFVDVTAATLDDYMKSIAPEGAPTKAGSPHPVFCTPCDTPLMLATSVEASGTGAAGVQPLSFRR